MPVPEYDPSFIAEIWSLYAVGLTVLGLRFVVRLKSVGFRGLQGDDAFAFLTLIMYTLDAVTVHLVYYMGTNVEAAAIQATRALTDTEIADYEFGSQIELVAWYSYTGLIWTLKGTMLCFFYRMTRGLWQHRLVKYLSYACVVTYIAVFLTVTFGCFPTSHNWQVVPNPGLKCTFKPQNFYVSVVLNVLTDAAILCIPLPLLWTLQVPMKKKIVIGALLCSGLFVITAAIIRVVLTLGNNPSALNVNRWGVRETIVGIITVNIPILRPMISRTFWRTGQVSSYAAGEGGTTTKTGKRGHGGTLATGEGPYEMAGSVGGHSRSKNSFGGSEEYIIDKKASGSGGGARGQLKHGQNDVVVHTMYHVTSEDNAEALDRHDWDGEVVGGATRTIAYRDSNAV